MVQIFVKVDEAKVTPMEVSLTDGIVEDVMRQIQIDEDVYVTMHAKVLKRNKKLKSCAVTDGCTIKSRARCGEEEDIKTRRASPRRNKPRTQRDPSRSATENQGAAMVQ